MNQRQRLSKALFGNAYFLDVAAACSSRRPMSARQIGADLDIPDPIVHPILRRLLAGGVITALEPAGRSRPFQLVGGPFWTLIRQLDREVTE